MNLNETSISSFITNLLLQYQMVEENEDGDYDTGDQGNAPHLKGMMKMRLNFRMFKVVSIMTLISDKIYIKI